jgi:hypothetical protein
MAAVRDILIHVEVQTASGKRKCHHKPQQHAIKKDQRCLAIHDKDGGRKNYCPECAMDILNRAEKTLASFYQELGA